MLATSTLITLSILVSITPSADLPEVLARSYCESRWQMTAKNPNSTAKGVFQFIDGTWNHYCKGNVWSPIDQTKCYVKLHKKYPNWWRSSDRCVRNFLQKKKINNGFDVGLDVI